MLSGLRVLLFIVIPACVGLVVLHIPLTQLFFERGAFDRAATLATSQAVIYYAIGVPAIAMLFLLNNVYLSLNAPYSLVKFNLFNWLANLLFSLVLSRYWGHYGIALGTSISVTLTMMAMIYSLRRHQLKSLDVKSLINSGFKIGLVSAVMGLLLLLLLNTSDQIPAQPSQYFRFLQLTGLAAIGTLTYVVVGRWLNLDEWSLIKTVFGKL
jgi:putative peptidoglycan lipid II flippase